MKWMKKQFSLVILLALVFCAGEKEPKNEMQEGLTKKELLGKKIFFDTNLSNPPGQSCAACHEPLVGWTGPIEAINKSGAVYEGAVAKRFGNRKQE